MRRCGQFRRLFCTLTIAGGLPMNIKGTVPICTIQIWVMLVQLKIWLKPNEKLVKMIVKMARCRIPMKTEEEMSTVTEQAALSEPRV